MCRSGQANKGARMNRHSSFQTMAESLSFSPLLHCFEAFYYEILHQKEKARLYPPIHPSPLSDIVVDDGASHSVPPSFEEASSSDPASNFIAEQIQRDLKECLNRQKAYFAQTTGGVNQHIFQEALYVMTALADEIFLNYPFRGAEQWRLSLLEGQLFETQIAGELVFRRIDAVLESQDLYRFDLAQVYLMALSLGFLGKFHGYAQNSEIDLYKKRLYSMLYHESVHLFNPQHVHLMPQCHQHTLVGAPSRGLSDLKTWGKYAAFFVMGYLLIAKLVWSIMTHGMHHDIQSILTATRALHGEIP